MGFLPYDASDFRHPFQYILTCCTEDPISFHWRRVWVTTRQKTAVVKTFSCPSRCPTSGAGVGGGRMPGRDWVPMALPGSWQLSGDCRVTGMLKPLPDVLLEESPLQQQFLLEAEDAGGLVTIGLQLSGVLGLTPFSAVLSLLLPGFCAA